MPNNQPLPWSLRLCTICAVVLVRLLVGYHPHSGQDGHHGSQIAYGGDFEAQRHWMELTVNLPISQWYYYDLSYWGLDYPPLSAYQSWLVGKATQIVLGPEPVALDTSRGYEDATHKAFMRASVIGFDLALYATAAWLWTKPMGTTTQPHTLSSLLCFGSVMCQPSILLIDHGHFQYNTAALGLALWSFFLFTWKPESSMMYAVMGSVVFCCALSFKQMTLYYAPAIFAYLLGRCFQQDLDWSRILRRFVSLGLTVIATFALTWWPFIVYGPENSTAWDRLRHIIGRIFPFQRGLFEGKVSNIWCALSIQPFRIRQRIHANYQPLAALVLTLLMILPACVKLFYVGRQTRNHDMTKSHQRYLLWGVANTSLAFFLASFQVHEKSLLLAVTPISLLATRSNSSAFGTWFAFVATWTMWPLLVLDRLQVAYWCVMALFGVFRLAVSDVLVPDETEPSDQTIFERHWLLRLVPHLTALLMLGLHAAESLFEPPASMVDLFPVLWSVAGCGLCLFAWMISLGELYRHGVTRVKEKSE